MPLPPAIEFLAAQKDSSGNNLCSFGMFSAEVVVPAGATVRWESRPREYMNYPFRLLIDAGIVPNAFMATISIYGTRPFVSTIYPSARNMQIDYFLRIFQNQPVIEEVRNLTTLNQRWVSAVQFLDVASEETWLELERRLAKYFTPALQAAAPLNLTTIEGQLAELVRLTREGQVVAPPPLLPPREPVPVSDERRRRIIGPSAEGMR